MTLAPEQRAYALLALLDDAEMRDIVPCYPSGRLDAFVDLGNPMKGVNLFPYLQRYREGRALRAVGPSEWLELSRTAAEVTRPARWPHEVDGLFFGDIYIQMDVVVLSRLF